ncbi:MAG: glucosaminidase domain-containing protein, partial [Lachnospiraceae bacterium]|nr:glucosaminidase domain-containing protein [Lachnospiraceae bacterium]
MTKQQFIEAIAGLVKKYAYVYGITVHSPIIAQAILESGWGESKLAATYHNYFGLKCGTKWKGKSVNLSTQEEYTAGTLTTITDNFRVYDSMEEGVKGYFEFIQLTRYQNLRGITSPKKYLETIKADGY